MWVAISDSSMVGAGASDVYLRGCAGISAIEVTLTGPDHDLHSGVFGGAVEEPGDRDRRGWSRGLHDKT